MASNVRDRARGGTPGPGTGVERVTPREALRQLLGDNRDAITLSLPRQFNEDRFVRLLLTAANTTPKLFECNPISFLAAGVHLAQLGLEPNDARGLAYLVPFWDGRRKENVVVPIIGYRGFIDLATRSGLVTGLFAQAVFADDEFDYFNDERGRHIHHRPNPDGEEDPATITHVYASALVSGDARTVVLSRRKVEEAKAASQTGRKDEGPWRDWYQSMAEKTAVRRLGKWLPLSVEAAHAVEVDERERALSIGELGLRPLEDDERDDAPGAAIDATSSAGDPPGPDAPPAQEPTDG